MIGTLMPACLLLAVAQVAAPTPPPGACDVGTLPTKLEVVELACCSGTGCALTGTSVCSLGCATVLTPLLKSCSAELTAAGAGSLVNELGPACEKATIAADPDSVAVGTHCRYADFLPVTMVCASYLQLTSAALEADRSFCTSACFEQASAFHTRCASKMSSMMRYTLGAVGTEVEKPVSKCSSGGGYDRTDTLICEATGAAAVVSAACADASSLLPGQSDGAATAADLRKAMCNSDCTTAIAGLSTACRHDPIFAQAIDVADACRDIHESSQCVDVADSFKQIADSECCGSPGACASGAMPNTCSAACSMSVLPFIERCGAAVTAHQTDTGGKVEASYMDELAALCSPHRRR